MFGCFMKDDAAAIEALKRRIKELEKTDTERRRAEKINTVLFEISNSVNTTQDLDNLYRSIHRSLGRVIDVTNFFIAIADSRERTLHFPYHVDTVDDDFPPINNFDINDSLTGLVVSRRKPVLLKKETLQARQEKGGIWGPMPLIWLGVPLMIREEVIGVVAVQSYTDPDLYKHRDLKVLSAVSDQMAIAIDRKRSEDALRESERRYRLLFKNAPAGICEIDMEKGCFLSVNDIMCEHTGYSEEEFFALAPMDLLAEESKTRYRERIRKMAAGEKVPDNVEFTIVKKNGGKVCTILNSDLIYRKGKPRGVRVVAYDITERKKAEREKVKAQQYAAEQEKLALVGQVAGKMAHDFNNILSVIMGNAELLLHMCAEGETKRRLGLIFDQTRRGKNLTKNLVVFAKDQEPKQEFFNLVEKVNLVLNLLKKDLRQIRIVREDGRDLPKVLADPGMIEHVLVNLVQNAVHALSLVENPQITLRTFLKDEHIGFEIADNGCGIPAEYLSSIYDPSFTLKGSRDTRGAYKAGIKGTGYGMANVKKYIEQHRGVISVASEIGSGTAFTVTLPYIRETLTKAEKEAVRQMEFQTGRTILIVEDEKFLSDVQSGVLSRSPCHHEVDVADSGEVAMDLFDRNTYDLVSLDYVLPGKFSGIDVYHHIRGKDSKVPVLFISGNIEFLESIKELKREDPLIDHISKPCENKAYVSRINMLLKQKE